MPSLPDDVDVIEDATLEVELTNELGVVDDAAEGVKAEDALAVRVDVVGWADDVLTLAMDELAAALEGRVMDEATVELAAEDVVEEVVYVVVV